MSDADHAAVEELNDSFGAALHAQDLERSMALLDDSDDVAVIPSEGVDVHRGTQAVRGFFERIYNGPRRYGWTWDERWVLASGGTGWFVAIGSESVDESSGRRHIPYCLTGVAVRGTDGWRLRLLHASEDSARSNIDTRTFS